MQQPSAHPNMNAPRAPDEKSRRPALNMINSDQQANLTEMLRARNTQKHEHKGAQRQAASQQRLDTENAYIFDRMSKGGLRGHWHDFKQMANPFSGTTIESREKLREHGAGLKSIKKEFKASNPEAVKHEKRAKAAKDAKTAASAVSLAGSGVALVNPVLGAGTKIIASAAGVAAGAYAADQFKKAGDEHQGAVDPSATRDKMFLSNMSQGAAQLNHRRAEHEEMNAAFSAVTAVTGNTVGLAMQGATEAARMGIGAAHTTVKTGGGGVAKYLQENELNAMKSDIINNMKHLASRNVEKDLKMKPKGVVIGGPPDVKRQNAMSNVHQGAGPQLHRQNASRKVVKD